MPEFTQRLLIVDKGTVKPRNRRSRYPRNAHTGSDGGASNGLSYPPSLAICFCIHGEPLSRMLWSVSSLTMSKTAPRARTKLVEKKKIPTIINSPIQADVCDTCVMRYLKNILGSSFELKDGGHHRSVAEWRIRRRLRPVRTRCHYVFAAAAFSLRFISRSIYHAAFLRSSTPPL